MITLSLGDVAGMMNGAVGFLQFMIPLLLALTMVASVRDTQNSATTWSVIGRAIGESWWPTLLRTDSARFRGVRRSVQVTELMSSFTRIILFVASVVTPIGLGIGLKASSLRTLEFEEVPDLSYFGQATPPRPPNPFSTRTCNGTCPASWIKNDLSLPPEVAAMFTSHTGNSSVSGPFDIQWRKWTPADLTNTTRRPYSKAGFSSVDLLILREAPIAVDGLVVDTRSSGIGFRKHTAPANAPDGASWDEDLLWVQPETRCVDTNFTLNLIPDVDVGSYKRTYIKDRGGFSKLARAMPDARIDARPADLYARALATAWNIDILTMRALGILSNDTVNQDFRPAEGEEYDILTYSIEEKEGPSNSWLPTEEALLINDILPYWHKNLSTTAFQDIDARFCSGYDDDTTTDGRGSVELPHVRCGIVFGIPYRADGVESKVRDTGVPYQQQVFVCASAVKASVKTVDFFLNGTTSLANVVVKDVRPSTQKSLTWASERPVSTTPMRQRNLLWGLVSAARWSDDYYVSEGDQYTLPAGGRYTFFSGADDLAVASSFQTIINTVYMGSASWVGAGTVIWYAGINNFALLQKWTPLSRSAAGAAEMINLIWTDIAASAVVGTKSRISAGGARSAQVLVYSTAVTYEDVRYAIPAIIAVGMCLCLFVAALYSYAAGFVRLSDMSFFSNHLSPGRLWCNLSGMDPAAAAESSYAWSKGAGRIPLQLTSQGLRSQYPPWRESTEGIGGLNKRAGRTESEIIDKGASHHTVRQDTDTTLVVQAHAGSKSWKRPPKDPSLVD